jgi:hypothetical protein
MTVLVLLSLSSAAATVNVPITGSASATLLNDTPDKRITKSRIIGFFDFNTLFINKPLQ